MKLKITFRHNDESNENEIESFVCLPNNKAHEKDLAENQIFIDGSSVPMRFYSNYFEYVVKGNTVEWSDQLVAKYSKE